MLEVVDELAFDVPSKIMATLRMVRLRLSPLVVVGIDQLPTPYCAVGNADGTTRSAATILLHSSP